MQTHYCETPAWQVIIELTLTAQNYMALILKYLVSIYIYIYIYFDAYFYENKNI